MRKLALTCLKLAAAASLAISMGLSAATPVAAFSGDQWQHIVDCAGWLFTNPARHDAECGPGHLGDITSDSRGWSFQAGPPAPKKTCDDHYDPSRVAFRSEPVDPLLVPVEIYYDDCGCPIPGDYEMDGDASAFVFNVANTCPSYNAFHFDGTELPEFTI